MTDLVWSIKNGDLSAVKEKIENEKVDIKNPIEGRTLLHYAAGKIASFINGNWKPQNAEFLYPGFSSSRLRTG
jgi:hypothetical protein